MHSIACHRFNVDSTMSKTRMGRRAIGQDGQVTILDLPKAHGIPYMEVYSLQPCTLLDNTVSKLPCGTADGIFQSYLLLKGNTIPVAWSTV